MGPGRISNRASTGVAAHRSGAVKKAVNLSSDKIQPSKLYVGSSHLFNEHPRLAVEIMDAQRSYSSKEGSLTALRSMRMLLNSIRELNESPLDVKARSDFSRFKFQIKKLSQTKMYGTKILSSDLRINDAGRDYIYFRVPGFDMEREKYQDEVVTLHIAGKLFSIPFNTMYSPMEQRREIISAFGRQLFDVKISMSGDILIGIDDESWVLWDRKVRASGWGFRYAQDMPVDMPVLPEVPTVQQIIDLEHGSEGSFQLIDAFSDLIELRIREYSQLVKDHVEGVQFLTKMAGPLPSTAGSLKAAFLSNPRQALSMVSLGFNGPTRDNVVKMVSTL
ncbi:hypothetical protein F7U66_00775 [Vibrio parahaemolyticus]|nr:hypothetical protein [Vibrio parahaemolyticus]